MDNLGYNTGYVEELYIKYILEPESVPTAWHGFFETYQPSPALEAVVRDLQNRKAATEAPVAPIPVPEAPAPVAAAAQPKGAPAKPVAAAKPAVPQPPLPEGAEKRPLKGAPARLAQNMDASLSVPTATSFFTLPVKLMAENRRLINEYQKTRGGMKVSFTHIIAWAMVKALQKFPNLYTAFRVEDEKPFHVVPQHINLGIAVSAKNKDGSSSLVVPNIKNADTLTFAQFVEMFDSLAKRARQGTLDISDFVGTTATLTNPGMIGTFMSVPRLMVGQGVIVATGAITYPPEYMALPPDELSRMGISQVMGLTSTYDHRIIQGAESGAFLATMGELITGKQEFYRELFKSIGMPHPPFAMHSDSTPVLGRIGSGRTEYDMVRKQARVMQLIRAYRANGHVLSDTNPLGYEPHYPAELDPAEYGLTIWDLDRTFFSDGLAGTEEMTLREIFDILWDTYTRKIGFEFMHITEPNERNWLQDRIEEMRTQDMLSSHQKVRAMERLNAAEALERFIHTKYIGHKRFSLEGGESLIPILDRILCDAADQEVKEVVIGMPHRGRLNVLTNILNKPYEKVFAEFAGNIDPKTMHGSGDVKYHLGQSGTFVAPSGAQVLASLTANPSHLEAVSPVVEGMARAIQEKYWVQEHDKTVNFDRVLPILIHGDAAFAGQGVVAETLAMSQLKGYQTGGTIHVIVNNQIGFTTNPEDARSSRYSSDMAMMIQAPVVHVNGDDPEACIRAARLVMDYRQVFNKDVVIDMVCYRKFGHNEGDDPSYTQPLMYKLIEKKRSVRYEYTELLLRRGDLKPEQAEKILGDFDGKLLQAFDQTKSLNGDTSKAVAPKKAVYRQNYDTKASLADVDLIVERLANHPDGFAPHPKLLRQLEARQKRFTEKGEVDWALGEALAFGTILLEGNKIRLSGEDCQRGTFSHRHAVMHDVNTDARHTPLNHLRAGQHQISIYDSLLSEYAVLGFDYGYAVADPKALVIWEAQFGDFGNGAQIMFDQFLVAAEAKWQQTCSLVCLLPHGYEGQGPEHSSARLERYLQLCAEDNIQVCNFSTPANLFHALRRQLKLDVPKPLIIMSPKSLLRHKLVVSHVEDFTKGAYQPVIPAVADPATAKRLVFCSGKMSCDIREAIEAKGGEVGNQVAMARLEQFYPFPMDEVIAELKRYPNVTDICWVQEEPENMGAGRFVKPYFDAAIAKVVKKGKPIRYIGRKASASTATGNSKVHAAEQAAIIDETLSV